MCKVLYLFDERDLDRVGPDITLLKETRELVDFITVSEKSRNEVVARVLHLKVKTILVPSDQHRCTPVLITVRDILRQLGFVVRTMGEHLYRTPAAYHATGPALTGAARGTGTLYKNNDLRSHTG